jgi:hypothetical protein
VKPNLFIIGATVLDCFEADDDELQCVWVGVRVCSVRVSEPFIYYILS